MKTNDKEKRKKRKGFAKSAGELASQSPLPSAKIWAVELKDGGKANFEVS